MGLSEQRYKTHHRIMAISGSHDTLSGSVFAWVHAATKDLPPPGPYPTGKKTAEVQAATSGSSQPR